jgi:hypothetical protein
MMSSDEYPVYNHRERPGIGKDLSGNLFYNCFSVKLLRNGETGYRPFLFSDFIRQYNQYTDHSGACASCVSRQKVHTYPVGKANVDRAAFERKFNHGEADPATYHFCPLIKQVLSASSLTAEVAQTYKVDDLPAKPIQAILSGNWDDEYLLEFERLAAPCEMQNCVVLQDLLSDKFISTPAERSFFVLWFLAIFQQMDSIRQSGQRVYLEDTDFDWNTSKIFRFAFPIPQVWLYIIPKPPPGVDWQEWEKQHQKESLPQRVDFLFIHNKKRYVVEIDDVNHYGVQSKGAWLASESRYRQTLADTRWLKVNGFEVLRFTNEEILELYNPNTPSKPDVAGFAKLLRTVFLEPKHMAFL